MASRNGLCEECRSTLGSEQSVQLQVARCGWAGTFHARCCGVAALRTLQTCDTRHEKALALEALELYLAAQRQELSTVEAV